MDDYQSINTATEEVLKTYPTISDADLDEALARAHDLYRSDWSLRSVAERCRILARAAAQPTVMASGTLSSTMLIRTNGRLREKAIDNPDRLT